MGFNPSLFLCPSKLQAPMPIQAFRLDFISLSVSLKLPEINIILKKHINVFKRDA